MWLEGLHTSYLYENNLRYQLKGPANSNGKADWAGLYCAGILKWTRTLDSGINVAPGITVAPPHKKFHITILLLFYTNLGIAVIFKFFLSSKFFKN